MEAEAQTDFEIPKPMGGSPPPKRFGRDVHVPNWCEKISAIFDSTHISKVSMLKMTRFSATNSQITLG